MPYSLAHGNGILSTAADLLFIGQPDGNLLALDAGDGSELWRFQTGAAIAASPVAYEVDGEQYVSFMVGWGGAFPHITGPISLSARVRPEARVATSLKHSFTVSANMVMTPVGVGAVGYRLAKHKVPEKHRIVVALVCGVGMLFVEMILFLARTYSVEAHTAKRERRAAAGRFGPAGLREATRLDGVAPKLP